jgi:membrane protease YdiL (CAAX protease family)
VRDPSGEAVHLLLLAGFALGCLVLLWAGQAVGLLLAGERGIWVWPYRSGNDARSVRLGLKIALHAGLLATLFVFPWCCGADPLQYHAGKFMPFHFGRLIQTFALTAGLLFLTLLIGLRMGWVELSIRHSPKRLLEKLAKSFLIPIPLTMVEEPLFRGLQLEELLQVLPAGIAIVLGAALFSAAHFIRPQKRPLLPALGLFAVGLLLGVAYVRSGHNCLLPLAIHAGGVWFIQFTRPLTTYRGPVWLVGSATYPIGALGMLAMVVVGVAMPALP